MKVFFAGAALWVAFAPASFCQGIVILANAGPGVNAPITNAGGNLIVGPSSYVADLFWSTDTNAPMDSMSTSNMPVQFSSQPGYFYPQGRNVGLIATPILAQVRAWDSNYGSTYYQARDTGGEFGFSNPVIVTPDWPPGGGTLLIGLQGFQLQRLPHFTATLTTTNTLVFWWPTEQTAYAVQQNLDLSPTNWTTLPNTPVTVGQEQQLVLPVPTTGRMFYRLISQ
jgi:hypothetical protein